MRFFSVLGWKSLLLFQLYNFSSMSTTEYCEMMIVSLQARPLWPSPSGSVEGVVLFVVEAVEQLVQRLCVSSL